MVVFKYEIPMLFRGTCYSYNYIVRLRKVSCSSIVNDTRDIDMRTIICSHCIVDDNVDDNVIAM